ISSQIVSAFSGTRPAATILRFSDFQEAIHRRRSDMAETATDAVASATTASSSYAHPDVLVTTEWVAQHLNDPSVRIVEADEDPLLYEAIGHIQNAVKLDWHTDVQDPVRRDFLDKAAFEALMSRYGIGNDTTVVFYGDKNNW